MYDRATQTLSKAQENKQEVYYSQTLVSELSERITKILRHDGSIEAIKGLHLHRVSVPRGNHSVLRPSFCLIAQGSKEVFLGNERYPYDPAHYLLVTAGLSTTSQIIEASKERPYLSICIDLNSGLVSSVTVEAKQKAMPKADVRAMDVSPLDSSLLDTVLRLVRLIDSPKDAPFPAPLILKELVYRLLMGEQSNRLCLIAVPNEQSHRIIQAIERLRKDYNQALKMERIAEDLGMSVSSFHHHFKAVTAMSPLQFQKRIRLQEARRLMLAENFDATGAAFKVDYEDASHFNREYKKLFGLPPIRDVERLRKAARDSSERAIPLVA